MRFLKAALATAGVSALLLGAVAAPAAADTKMPVLGGHTTVTTAPGVVAALTSNGILMRAGGGATDKLTVSQGVVTDALTFAITKPSSLVLEDNPASSTPVGAVIGGVLNHKGDVYFVNTTNGKQVSVGTFAVNFAKGKVFATELNGDAIKPMAVFTIQTVKKNLFPDYNKAKTSATLSGIRLFVAPAGAAALNTALGTTMFATDGTMAFGRAHILVEFS